MHVASDDPFKYGTIPYYTEFVYGILYGDLKAAEQFLCQSECSCLCLSIDALKYINTTDCCKLLLKQASSASVYYKTLARCACAKSYQNTCIHGLLVCTLTITDLRVSNNAQVKVMYDDDSMLVLVLSVLIEIAF